MPLAEMSGSYLFAISCCYNCLSQGWSNSQRSCLCTELCSGATQSWAWRWRISERPTCPHQSASDHTSLCECL